MDKGFGVNLAMSVDSTWIYLMSFRFLLCMLLEATYSPECRQHGTCDEKDERNDGAMPWHALPLEHLHELSLQIAIAGGP